MQDVTVTRVQTRQEYRLPSSPSFKCNVLSESLSVDSQNIPCATLKRSGSWVISVHISLVTTYSTRVYRIVNGLVWQKGTVVKAYNTVVFLCRLYLLITLTGLEISLFKEQDQVNINTQWIFVILRGKVLHLKATRQKQRSLLHDRFAFEQCSFLIFPAHPLPRTFLYESTLAFFLQCRPFTN
jgi:hypothetical protein